MKLNQSQKRELINSAKIGIEYVDMTIRKLKVECPDAFHTDSTLVKRKFQHRPNTETPCRNFLGDLNS
ncbi:MAG: hypothetical protein WCA85_32410 [Paraburkholderia sp.]|uniref:hypothetical protein n=1 Tax=Paraburkholderia sp. TaxID=1926495 RepID=UPI003C44FEDB